MIIAKLVKEAKALLEITQNQEAAPLEICKQLYDNIQAFLYKPDAPKKPKNPSRLSRLFKPAAAASAQEYEPISFMADLEELYCFLRAVFVFQDNPKPEPETQLRLSPLLCS